MAGLGSLLPEINNEFHCLDQGGRIMAEYVWIGGSGEDIRSKTKVLDEAPKSVDDLPIWNYDGSSTGQAPGHDSEVLIKPARIFRDPFRQGQNIIVLCDTYILDASNKLVPLQLENSDGNNTRAKAQEIFENPKVKSQKLWYGIEQEYTLFHKNGKTPLGWPEGGYPRPQGPYYCSAGVENSFGRDIVEAHLKACLHAGVKLSGANAEVMPAQWEYQVGPCEGIESGDHVWMARYLMYRVCEKYGVQVSFYPKPIEGDWNGTGCHTNVSTLAMRDPKNTETYTPSSGPFAGQQLKGGFAKIIEAVDKMGPKHQEHIAVYGKDNSKRLTGKHETANINTWRYGVADRGASVRITRDSVVNGYGYFEDRRPASNMDPYVVTSKIAATILL